MAITVTDYYKVTNLSYVPQTLNTISAEKNSTIVFPLPIDLLTYFVKAQEAISK
jgi:hypothetical protein